MATLLHNATGTRAVLSERHLFGRAPWCHTVLADDTVSAEHATIHWEDGRWWVKDLGSRNGTSLACPLASGERRSLEGDVVVFGASRWTVVDLLPPNARARSEATVREAVCGLLALPSEDVPEATVFVRDDRWILEAGDLEREVASGELLEVAGTSWTLELPTLVGTVDRTRSVSRVRHGVPVRLVLDISQDQEHIDVVIDVAGRVTQRSHRSHHDLLRALALQRMADHDTDLPASECGWTDLDALQRELRLSRRTIDLHVFRIRQMLAEAGMPDAALAIERRASTQRIRLGLTDVGVR